MDLAQASRRLSFSAKSPLASIHRNRKRRDSLEKAIKFRAADGLCRQSPDADLSFVDFFRYQRIFGACAVLVYLADMSNEAVEYVRGIPVINTFGQTVFSFKKFKATIDHYKRWTIAYTKEMRGPMCLYTLAVNSVFVFLILGGFWFSQGTIEPKPLLNLLFYIILTPVISLTLSKLMFMSKNGMIVQDALARIDSVLNAPSLSQSEKPQHPKDNAVKLEYVTFSYDGEKNALEDVSLAIGAGQMLAFVGPSGGGKSTLASLIARFFDPQEGGISIGGVDVKQIDKEELMDTVSFVFQNSYLIKGSILDNVRMGKPNATEAEVLAALKAARCMDIIENSRRAYILSSVRRGFISPAARHSALPLPAPC